MDSAPHSVVLEMTTRCPPSCILPCGESQLRRSENARIKRESESFQTLITQSIIQDEFSRLSLSLSHCKYDRKCYNIRS